VTIAFNFFIFSLLIFASDALVSFSVVRLERRSSTPAGIFFNVFPSYIKKVFSIFIVFAAVELTYLQILDTRYFIFLPLLIIFMTTIKVDSDIYTRGITSSSYLLSIVLCVLTAQSTVASQSVVLSSPFAFV
jgi:hypothetical protein